MLNLLPFSSSKTMAISKYLAVESLSVIAMLPWTSESVKAWKQLGVVYVTIHEICTFSGFWFSGENTSETL